MFSFLLWGIDFHCCSKGGIRKEDVSNNIPELFPLTVERTDEVLNVH